MTHNEKKQDVIGFELMMAELIDHIQDPCPEIRQEAALRKIVAQFGDAYFFYNQTGDFCLLTRDSYQSQ